MTYQGGCKEWTDKNLQEKGGFYADKIYTVKECYDLCLKESECGGFFITKATAGGIPIGSCLLYSEGCTNDGNANMLHYALEDCQTKSNIFLYLSNLV